ncbi:MAG TPA: hypothetical protein VMW54_12880 [Terriglobia bacterium]|nr:hypothetical protein [Terriglobia bacterium]
MGNDLAESSSLPYPDRRGWIITAGVIEILIGLGFLLLAASMAILPLRTHAPGRVPPSVAAILVAVGVYVVIAACFFVAGTGSVLRKNWARIMMLIGSGLWLLFGLMGSLISFLMLPRMLEMRRAVPPGAHHQAIAFVISIEVILGILLPLGFLIFYTRKSVKATFLDATAAAPQSASFPIPLAIVAIFEALGISAVLLLLVRPVTVAFGFIVHGWKAVLIGLAYSVFSGMAAWLIYKRRLAGWNIAFIKALVAGGSMALSISIQNTADLMAQTGWQPQQPRMAQWFPQMMHAVFIGTAFWIGAYVLFLIYTRKFFFAKPPADSAPA